jgi:hypothetical protein
MEQMMTSICIRCLNLEDHEVLSSNELSTKVLTSRQSSKEFIEYCCEWWTTHYGLSQDVSGDDIFQDVLALYDIEGEAFKYWFDQFWAKSQQYDWLKRMTPIRLAALSHHDRVLEHLLSKTRMDVDAEDEIGRRALYWVAQGYPAFAYHACPPPGFSRLAVWNLSALPTAS